MDKTKDIIDKVTEIVQEYHDSVESMLKKLIAEFGSDLSIGIIRVATMLYNYTNFLEVAKKQGTLDIIYQPVSVDDVMNKLGEILWYYKGQDVETIREKLNSVISKKNKLAHSIDFIVSDEDIQEKIDEVAKQISAKLEDLIKLIKIKTNSLYNIHILYSLFRRDTIFLTLIKDGFFDNALNRLTAQGIIPSGFRATFVPMFHQDRIMSVDYLIPEVRQYVDELEKLLTVYIALKKQKELANLV